MTVVGVGIETPAHVTAEAQAAIESADEVLYLVADQLSAAWIASVNPRARSLHEHYAAGRHRSESYAAMVDEVLAQLADGGRICLALYGHPGVYSTMAHQAIARAREDGIEARMLPGISAEDCLFAELGVDPGRVGLQSYDASDLLIRRRELDPSAALVLWQVAVVGRLDHVPNGDASRLPLLRDYLARWYPLEHELVAYSASPYPFLQPVIERFALAELADAELPRVCLLYVSPAIRRPADFSVVESRLATA